MKENTLDKKRIIIISAFLLFVLVICSTWAITMVYDNLNGPPDERMKYDVCKYIFENKTLPHGGDEAIRDKVWGISYAFNPILSYIFSAIFMLITSLFTSSERIIFISSRFVSVICLTMYAFMNIKISQKLFKKKIYSWLFVVMTTLLPQVVFLGSYLNNDSLALLSISIIVYSWIIGLESNWDYKSCIILGLGIGICSLSYYNAYGYILTSIIVFLIHNFLKKNSIKTFLKKGLIISAVALLIAGWWFIRSYIIYDGDIFGLNISREYSEKYALEQYKPSNRNTPAKDNISLKQMLIDRKWLENTIDSSIGMFGHMTIVMDKAIYKTYKIVYVVALLGILIKIIKDIYGIFKSKKDSKDKETVDEESKNTVLLNLVFIINIIIPIALSIYYSYFSDFQSQGRYIMPIIIPFTYFIVNGIMTLCETLIKNEKIKNVIVFSFICIWSIMPIVIYFKYIA